MLPNLKPIDSYKRNVYSQFGEDGIIEEVLRRISVVQSLSKFCVEFGAWDGLYLSNCARLLKEETFRGVLIEADKKKFKDLLKQFPGTSVHKVQALVDVNKNSIDNILSKLDINEDIDLMSIDIDGADYWILNSLTEYIPKVLVIEFNPTIPNSIDFFQELNFSVKHGSSAAAICRLANEKGFALVATTHCNLVFVRNEFTAPVLGQDNGYRIENIRDDSEFIHQVFVGYDGTIFLDSTVRIYWHELYVSEKSIQLLPSALRRFPSDYNIGQKLFWIVFKPYLRLKKKIYFKNSR